MASLFVVYGCMLLQEIFSYIHTNIDNIALPISMVRWDLVVFFGQVTCRIEGNDSTNKSFFQLRLV